MITHSHPSITIATITSSPTSISLSTRSPVLDPPFGGEEEGTVADGAGDGAAVVVLRLGLKTCEYFTVYRIRQIPVHKRALLRESNLREIALSVRRARRFPRNLVSTIQPDTVCLIIRFALHPLILCKIGPRAPLTD